MNVNKDLCSNSSIDNIKLKYGLRDNKLVDINEITTEQKGLRCNCVCPNCGKKLQAKLGKGKRQPHFAHNENSCNTVIAQQSALHILAKEIIQQEKKVCLPALKIKMSDIPNEIIGEFYYQVPEELVFRQSQVLNCEYVELEKRISEIVPDIIVTVDGKEYLIEIAVTHFIDEAKNEKIKKMGLPVIEIDLSSLSAEEFSRESVKKLLLEDNNLKKWIYTPLMEEAYNWALNQYKNKISQIVKKIEEAELESKKLREQKEKKRLITQKIINDLQNEEYYKQAINNLRSDDSVKLLLRRRAFYSNNMDLPFYMDIPITGEMVFVCDRRIWQSAVFNKFVYNRKPDENHVINIQRIETWIIKYQKEFKINWDMSYKGYYSFGNVAKEQNLLYSCLKEYLYYLSYIGFISNKPYTYSDNYKVLAIHTLEPPNKEASLILKEIIKKVNQYTWNVSREIYDLIQPKRSYTMNSIGKNRFTNISSDDFFYHISEKERRDELKKIKYEAGLNEIISNNLLIEGKIAKDSFGYKWFVCKECGVVKREDEMVEYKGIYGICRECNRNNIN